MAPRARWSLAGSSNPSSWRVAALVPSGVALSVACTTEPGGTNTTNARTPVEPGDEFYDDDIPPSNEPLTPMPNDGDSIKLEVGTTLIDTLTYPAFSNLTSGRSLAFPDDCPWNLRADWQRWSLTFVEWKPGFKGTPNATNGDVACY